MMTEPSPKSALQMEQRQLTACRWGFLLLGAGVLLQLVAPLFFATASDPPRTPRVGWYLAMATVLLVPQLPAAWLLGRRSRSRRWRIAALALGGTLLVDSGLLLTLATLREPGVPMANPEPPVHRLIEAVCGLMTWVELWWTAVLVAEFAMASRAMRLVSRTELLGYGILGGGAASLLLAAWTFATPSQRIAPEGLTFVLIIVEQLVLFITITWSLYLLAGAATLARILAAKCREVLVEERST
jgi:hypothetical protein